MILVLLIPATCYGQDPGGCQAVANNCVITTATGGTIGVGTIQQNTTGAPTDTQGNTYNILVPAIGGGTGCLHLVTIMTGNWYECHWYARTNSHSGSDTVTIASASGALTVQFMTSSQVVAVGNPLDKFCTCSIPSSGVGSTCVTPVLSSGSATVSTCTIQSTRANDPFLYLQEQDYSATQCTFLGMEPPITGPTGGQSLAGACFGGYISYALSNGQPIPSLPQSTLIVFGINNNSSLNTNYNAFLATYLAAPNGGAAKRKLPPFIVQNRGRPHRRVPA